MFSPTSLAIGKSDKFERFLFAAGVAVLLLLMLVLVVERVGRKGIVVAVGAGAAMVVDGVGVSRCNVEQIHVQQLIVNVITVMISRFSLFLQHESRTRMVAVRAMRT